MLTEKTLHIISFTIPFPANYGGVIDVFHKIRKLNEAGINIILHAFEYDRPQNIELNKYCQKVFYYKRNTGLSANLSFLPYIVLSRKSDELLNNLLKDNFPILFEGLHSCYFLNHPKLKNRFKIYRESNIEHIYYRELMKAEKSIFKKAYFYVESIKLEWFEKKLNSANLMLIVSESETRYFKAKFQNVQVEYLPSFHENDILNCQIGKGDYILYHGNLSVSENEFAVEYLLNKVFKNLKIPIVIAGLNPSKSLVQKISKNHSASLISNCNEKEMSNLIENAQVNILWTFQNTGLKLKLLNTLFKGRFCLVNSLMTEGTPLQSVCHIAHSPENAIQEIEKLMLQDFSQTDIENRKTALQQFDNVLNTQKFIELVFKA